jgi:peptidoglycan/xylan/chitin deacetylase (PgdA/CDA1 family)
LISRAIGRLRRRNVHPPDRSGRALILLYHRIARPRSDQWALAVTPRRFGEHLEVLRRVARPMRLGELSRSLLDGGVPDGAVVVTFDDGYADNLHNARPLLERYDVPATIFIPSGFLGSENEFWWDELDRLLLQPGKLPGRLSLNINGSTYGWELAEVARYRPTEARQLRGWRAWKKPPTPRHSIYQSLWKELHPMAEDARQSVLEELRGWANMGAPGRPAYRPLSLGEVRNLAQGSLIEVGAHTVTHPALSTLSVASQWDEIMNSKSQLEEILGRPVHNFAYPYGKQSDYSADTANLVREAGFLCACVNFAGAVERSTALYELPRIQVPNIDQERFAEWIAKWLNT